MEPTWHVPLPSETRPGLGVFGALSWDGEFGALLPEKLRGGHLGDVAALDISTFLINKQGSVDTDGPDCYLFHENDSVTVRNNIEGSSIDILVVIHNIWYKRTVFGNKGGKINEETKQYPYTLKYGETHTETNKEGRSGVKWGADSLVDTDITITLLKITKPKTDYAGNAVVDPATGKPVLTTTDAAGGTGVTDLPTENLKEYLMYGGVLVAVIVVGYGAYWYLSRQPKGASK